MNQFILSCESTVDLPYNYVTGRGLSVLFYTYSIDGIEYEDNMERSEQNLTNFYEQLADGKLPKTAQINRFRYEEYFKELVKKGDVLHIAFGTGMTPSYHNAVQAAEEINAQSEHHITVVDSLCSCCGYGLLVDSAADLYDDGKSMAEIIAFLEQNRQKVEHRFFSTDIRFFRRSGRVSGLAAMAAGVLGIFPLMCLNDEGRIIAYGKVRGKKAAVDHLIQTMKQLALNGEQYADKCFIGQSDCPELAEAVKDGIEQAFPAMKGKVQIYRIGNIISSHCGRGTVALFYYGNSNRHSDN